MATQELTLYLAPWQKRMMSDFMTKEQLKKIAIDKVTRMKIRNPIGQCLMSYKILATGMRKDDWLIYLTDEQMNIMKIGLGLRARISSINITKQALESGAISFA